MFHQQQLDHREEVEHLRGLERAEHVEQRLGVRLLREALDDLEVQPVRLHVRLHRRFLPHEEEMGQRPAGRLGAVDDARGGVEPFEQLDLVVVRGGVLQQGEQLDQRGLGERAPAVVQNQLEGLLGLGGC